MTDDGDRMARAGNYVLGLMDDEERERAERDLERDGEFRDAVVQIAERMHLFDLNAAPHAAFDTRWQAISARIGEMPQMRASAPGSDAGPARPVQRSGMHSVPGWRGAIVAASLMVACGVGYLAGSMNAGATTIGACEPAAR